MVASKCTCFPEFPLLQDASATVYNCGKCFTPSALRFFPPDAELPLHESADPNSGCCCSRLVCGTWPVVGGGGASGDGNNSSRRPACRLRFADRATADSLRL